MVASIGVMVSAAKVEMTTAPEITMLNSRNRRPVMPSMKTIGKKTAISVIEVEITAKKISLAPSMPASKGVMPRSMRM